MKNLALTLLAALALSYAVPALASDVSEPSSLMGEKKKKKKGGDRKDEDLRLQVR